MKGKSSLFVLRSSVPPFVNPLPPSSSVSVFSVNSVSFPRRRLWYLHVERGTAAADAVDPDLARVIGDDRLHDGEAEAGAVLLGRVVRREQSLTLLVGQAFAGV